MSAPSQPAERTGRAAAIAAAAALAAAAIALAAAGPDLVPGAAPDAPRWILGVFGDGFGLSPGAFLGVLYLSVFAWIAVWLTADRLGGRVYGPYRHQTRHYYTWLLRGAALKAAIPIFQTYLPESWRREQFERWLDQHSEYFAFARGAAVPSASISDVDRRGV